MEQQINQPGQPSQFNSPQVNPINFNQGSVNPDNLKKEKSKFSLIGAIVLTAVIVGGGVYWWMNNNQTRVIPPDNNQTSLPVTTQTDRPNWETYQNDSFKVSYPTDTFTASNLSGGVLLMSDVSVNENAKGTLNGGSTHTFSINFYTGGSLLEEIKKSPASYIFSDAFPSGTVESFNANINNGDIKRFSAAGRNGFMFTSGVEGIYTDYYFLPINPSTSLVVKFDYITDFLLMSSQKSQPQVQISGQEQKEIFASVISTLQFLK